MRSPGNALTSSLRGIWRIEELKQRLKRRTSACARNSGRKRASGKSSEAAKPSTMSCSGGQVARQTRLSLSSARPERARGWSRTPSTHQLRKERPMITVNCAALPANLIESELFGREKGPSRVHTPGSQDASRQPTGTIFLDEIGELPLELSRSFCACCRTASSNGWAAPRRSGDVRVIASTSRDLKEEVRAELPGGSLLPAQRIPVTIHRSGSGRRYPNWWLFADKYSHKIGKQIETIPKLAMRPFKSIPGRERQGARACHRKVRDHDEALCCSCRPSRAYQGR